jgi:hypothetical protein
MPVYIYIYMYSLEDVVYFIWSSVREKDQSPKFSIIEIFWTKESKFCEIVSKSSYPFTWIHMLSGAQQYQTEVG